MSQLGRPKGSLSKETKLTGKEEEIKDLFRKKVSVSAIGRILGVHRLTVDNFIKTKKLRDDVSKTTFEWANPMTDFP